MPCESLIFHLKINHPLLGLTPSVRDKLNINPEDGIDIGNTPAAHKIYQNSLKEQLKMGLSTLPQPKNDYEIVVPDNEDGDMPEQAQDHMVSLLKIINKLTLCCTFSWPLIIYVTFRTLLFLLCNCINNSNIFQIYNSLIFI